MGTITAGPFTDGVEAEIDLGFELNFPLHELTISIFDENGDPAETGVTGTLTATVQRRGADRPDPYFEPLDLSTDQRSWPPQERLPTPPSLAPPIRPIRAIKFFIIAEGLNTGYTYFVTVNSWGGTF